MRGVVLCFSAYIYKILGLSSICCCSATGHSWLLRSNHLNSWGERSLCSCPRDDKNVRYASACTGFTRDAYDWLGFVRHEHTWSIEAGPSYSAHPRLPLGIKIARIIAQHMSHSIRIPCKILNSSYSAMAPWHRSPLALSASASAFLLVIGNDALRRAQVWCRWSGQWRLRNVWTPGSMWLIMWPRILRLSWALEPHSQVIIITNLN